MTKLVRDDLRESLRAARNAHPGLLLQRGWIDYVKTDAANEGKGGKGEHINRLCAIPVEDFYRHAYDRWLKLTADTDRFTRIAMKIEGRLLIGLAGGGALETGCAVSHTYGAPYLPGSSIKGVVRAWAEEYFSNNQSYLDEIFGTQDMSGLMSFHDAWWVPGSVEGAHKDKPFAQDIVTPHHPDYYAGSGASLATDLDSPVPNGLISVRGSFLFVIEGQPLWLKLARTLLEKALGENGIGAKTRAGYGYLSVDSKFAEQQAKEEKRKAAAQNYLPAKLLRNPSTGAIKAILDGGKSTAPLSGEAAQALLEKLPEDVRNGKKIREGKLAVEVTVSTEGNMIQLMDIRMPSVV